MVRKSGVRIPAPQLRRGAPPLQNRETPLILGVIVIEDVFLALYLALLSPILVHPLRDAFGALFFFAFG